MNLPFFFFLTRFTHLDFSIVLYGFQSHIIFAKYNEFSVQNLLAVRFRYKVMFSLAPKWKLQKLITFGLVH